VIALEDVMSAIIRLLLFSVRNNIGTAIPVATVTVTRLLR